MVGLVPLRWFNNNLLIAGGDLPIPLDPAAGKFIRSFLYTWYSYLYGGEVNPHQFAILPWFGFWALLKSLGLSLLLINKLWFIFVFTFSGVSMHYLVSVVFKKANSILLFVAPLFYMFNVYVMVMTPTVATPLLYGALPLILGLFIKGLDERKRSSRYAILVALSSLLICTAIGNPPIYAILVIMILSYYLYYLLHNSKKDVFYSLMFNLKVGALYLIFNIWWLYPFIINVLFRSGDLAEAVVRSGFGRSFLLENFRLLGSWAFYSGSSGSDYFPFAHYYKAPLLIILTFLIPLMAFVSAFFKPRGKTHYFLIMALLGILLANGSGSAAPINKLLFRLPGFWIFREPFSKFTAITAISFAVLIGFSTSNIFDFIKRHKGENLAKFYLIGVVLVILISSWPILTGDLIFSQRGWMKSSHVEIPDYWFKAGDWFNNQKEDFRILVLPENPEGYYCGLNYKWGYGSADIVPYLIHQPLIEERAGLGASVGVKLSTTLANAVYDKILDFKTGDLDVKSLLQVLNIKYVLQRNDVEWELISSEDPFLFSPPHLQRVLSSEKYLSKDESLGDLDFYRISEESFLPHFYLPQKIIYSRGDIESLPEIMSFGDYQIRSGVYLEKVDQQTDSRINEVKERADQVIIKGELVNKIGKEETGEPLSMPLPSVRWKPGDFIYPLVLRSEEVDKWKARKEPQKLFKKHLFYASKRIAELINFDIKDVKQLNSLVGNYKQEMESAIGETKEAKELQMYLKTHRRKIEQTNLDKEIKNSVRDVFDDLEGKIAELETERDLSRLVYKLDIPKGGEYEIYIRDADDIGRKEADIGYQKLDISESTNPSTSSGQVIQYPVSNISSDNWRLLETKHFPEGEQELVLPFSGVSENLIDENLRIKDYQSESTYRISFDYKAPKGGGLFVAEGKEGETVLTDLLPTGEEFKLFEKFFKSSSGVTNASVHLSISVAEEKNLKVERIYQPEVILKYLNNVKEINGLAYNRTAPKITFVKINPTKYKIKVEEAKEPYTLVFSESFHQEWKAYIDNVKWDDGYGEVVASYFDGEIKEGAHRDVFLDRNTFETWGKKPLPEERHLLINGYANSWYVTPEDSAEREGHEIIIEFRPQRFFYIGLGISLLTLMGSLGYLGVEKIKR